MEHLGFGTPFEVTSEAVAPESLIWGLGDLESLTVPEPASDIQLGQTAASHPETDYLGVSPMLLDFPVSSIAKRAHKIQSLVDDYGKLVGDKELIGSGLGQKFRTCWINVI